MITILYITLIVITLVFFVGIFLMYRKFAPIIKKMMENLEKLNNIKKSETDESVITTLNETINKIKNTKFSTVELVKLKELSKTLIV